MGKGGMSHGEAKDGEENMAAWLMGVNDLKIQPFKLPPLGTSSFLHLLLLDVKLVLFLTFRLANTCWLAVVILIMPENG